MDIDELGGEFALIERIVRMEGVPGVSRGVGDDCAVLEHNDDFDLLVTTDLLLENTHFRLDWSTPRQIGVKAMESNVSDIAAMGGEPLFAFVSLGLPKDLTVEQVDGIYQGMYESCRRHDVSIVGGDTTKGEMLVINIALLGRVEKGGAVLRSTARSGDLVAVTGDLGGSEAGLRGLLNGLDVDVQAHLEPRARREWGRRLRPLATSMMDLSDGLAGDMGHICDESGVGVVLDGKSIPVAREAVKVAEMLGDDPLAYAIGGGEDFELLFTIDPKRRDDVERLGFATVIGRIVERGRMILRGGRSRPLQGGYDHFSGR